MKTLNRVTTLAALATVLLTMHGQTQAAVSKEEAAQLGTTLTPVGAEMAGNKDGSIPAWDVAKTLRSPPPGYKPRDTNGGGPYPDPYANEKPLFTITRDNVEQYRDKLDEGSIYLLKNRDGYRMDIYPTHRNVALPQFVYDNTKKCATTANLVSEGLSFEGAHACFPFPIPKNGYEAMWNGLLPYMQVYEGHKYDGWLIGSDGKRTFLGRGLVVNERLFWDNERTSSEFVQRSYNEWLSPASKAGTRDMRILPIRIDQKELMAYSYSPGLRRVRLAPELKYDTTVAQYGGVFNYDEVGIFDGKMDRFDFKLKGKKELYIIYNANKLQTTPLDKIAAKNFVNPEVTRWELHRVWVVEATVKPGVRHVQSKKVFYLDEDTWGLFAYNGYDKSGDLEKAQYAGRWADPVDYASTGTAIIYDFKRNNYALGAVYEDSATYQPTKLEKFSANQFSPEAMAGSGVR